MLTYWILLPVLLLLHVTAGTTANEIAERKSFNIDSSLQHVNDDGYPEMDFGIRRYECPAGFFRLRRNCYYLSGGVLPWREAHFQCTARNSTLAVLNRYGKDKILRKYLMGDQFRKLERWIGGIYNWRQMNWEWGESGDKVLFQNFGNPESMRDDSQNYLMHCIVLDPNQQYKWNARSCIEPKHYICEVPAGRIGKSRQRKNINDPHAPQNYKLRPSKKDDYKYKIEQSERRHRNKVRSMRKKNWHQHEDDNQIWAHGIKIGSRPPKGRRMRLNGKRGPPRHGRKHFPAPEPRISQATPSKANEFGGFPADGRAKFDDHQLQSLGNNEVVFPRLGNDFTREEILLKI